MAELLARETGTAIAASNSPRSHWTPETQG